MKDIKVASIIVTFNRKELLVKNIEAILNQTCKSVIYIIDNNSSDGTYDYLVSRGLLSTKSIKYINTKSNIGGAGGFAAGIKIAYDEGYEAIWLMDDDGRPMENTTLERLISRYNKTYYENKKIFINAIVISEDKQLSFRLGGMDSLDDVYKIKEDTLKDKVNPFNGTLISRELIECIGIPNKDFFIKGDEYEYFLRAKKCGAEIYTVLDSLYMHPKEPSNLIKMFNKPVKITDEAPWKEYYTSRNSIYISNTYFTKKNLIKTIMFRVVSWFYYSSNRYDKIKFSLRGIIDGLRGKLGITVIP